MSFQGWGPGEGKSKSLPLACFLFLSTFSWARGHERLPPVNALFRGFLSRLACWASAQRRSLGATIPRKMSAHRCCTVFTEQICDESRRRPRIILSYSQGLQRRVGANLPAKTDRGSCPLAPARAKRKWTPTRQNRRVKRAADSRPCGRNGGRRKRLPCNETDGKRSCFPSVFVYACAAARPAR